MKNILYIHPETNDITGGSICRKNNAKALSANANTYADYPIRISRSFIQKTFAVLHGYKCGLNRSHITNICRKVKDEGINIVFLDTSLYGKLAKILSKNTNAKIISFFHNCEYILYASVYKKKPLFYKTLILHSVKVNELFSLKYSSICVFLNERDTCDCKKKYGTEIANACFTPICIEDSYKKNPVNMPRLPKQLLFVGSYFSPNINGLIWFSKNVLPFIPYTLSIVGKGFDSPDFVSKLDSREKINIKGFVDKLDEEYEAADLVVQPVFEGSGMKTKTAEAFMFGKPLVTAEEGVSGYPVAHLRDVYVCNTAPQFIEMLDSLQKCTVPSFSAELRNEYLNLYSLDTRCESYKLLLEKINE